MNRLAQAEREHDQAMAKLALRLAGLCRRARASDDERAEIVDLLVTLGFDDERALDAIDAGAPCRRVD